jgi:hypothetical protein
MIIYKTTNLVNGKFYIGQDSNNDPNYLGSGLLINKAIKKYGKNNFLKEVLENCNSKEELDEKEKFWISNLSATTIGYNISFGGTGGDLYNCLSEEEKINNIKIKSQNAKIKNIMYEKNVFECWVEKYGINEAVVRMQNFKQKLSKTQKEKENIKLSKIREDYGDFILKSFGKMTIDKIHQELKGVVSKKYVRLILKEKGVNVLNRKGRNQGEKNGMSKLNCDDVLKIISLKKNKKVKEIAKIYNISVGQTSLILNGKSYKKCYN